MQYWANINGKQFGPVQKDELLGLGLTQESYIWYEGLDEWVQVKSCDELADLFKKEPSIAHDIDLTIGKHDKKSLEDVDDSVKVADTADDDVKLDAAQSEPVPPALPQYPYRYFQPQYAAAQRRSASPVPDEPCPPTYLGWAIATTLLCCQIFGIIAIVYSAKVTTKYNLGDLEGAKKCSDNAALWSILSIVTGIICIPFVIAFQLLSFL